MEFIPETAWMASNRKLERSVPAVQSSEIREAPSTADGSRYYSHSYERERERERERVRE